MNGYVVANGFDELRKTYVVPWEDLSIGGSGHEGFRHVPLVIDIIWRFFPGTGTIWKRHMKSMFLVNAGGWKITALGSRVGDDNGNGEEQCKDDGCDAQCPILGAGGHPIIFVETLLGVADWTFGSCNTA